MRFGTKLKKSQRDPLNVEPLHWIPIQRCNDSMVERGESHSTSVIYQPYFASR